MDARQPFSVAVRATLTRVECRLPPRVPRVCIEQSGYRDKVFHSETLTAIDLNKLYTELVAMDLIRTPPPWNAN